MSALRCTVSVSYPPREGKTGLARTHNAHARTLFSLTRRRERRDRVGRREERSTARQRDAKREMGVGDGAVAYPSPPASARSNASVRSAASYRKLESRHATQKLADLIAMKVQIDAAETKTNIPPKSKSKLLKLAGAEAAKVVASGDVELSSLPKQIRAGFLLKNQDLALAAVIEGAAAVCAAGLAELASKQAAPPEPTPTPTPPTLEVSLPATHPKFQRRLPPVSVAGRPVQLEQLIRDKIMQRGHGGAGQLRKAFRVFDMDGSGQITVDEMDAFLRSINIKVAPKTLYRFFEVWASEKTHADMDKWDGVSRGDATSLNYLEFVHRILPADYPKRGTRYADDIASIASEDRKKPLGEKEITTTHDFETAFRDKLSARSVGGGSEQLKQYKMFDLEGKGHVVFDDLIRAAQRWNLSPSAQVLGEVRHLWCKPENRESGIIDFYDFVNKVLPPDFQDVDEVLRVFYNKMTENWSALRDAFRTMDSDGSGTVSTSEIVEQLKRMNIVVPPELAQTFAEQFDKDGDGEVDFAEFSRAIRAMDPDAKKDKSAVGLLWDPDQLSAKKILEHRPASHASLHSECPADELEEENQTGMLSQRLLNKHGVDLHEPRTHRGKLIGQITYDEDGNFRQDGIPINFAHVLREKIYRKRGAVHSLRNAFQALDKDGSGAVSRLEFREFLKPYNLNLNDAALDALIDMFDDDHDGLITFTEFCQRVMPNDYDMLSTVDPVTGNSTQTMQGVPAMVRNRSRRVVQPGQTTNFGLFDSKLIAPYPRDERAVNLVREKVAQRTRNANDNAPSKQLRDALSVYDKQQNGRIEMDSFRRVLERYNVFLDDSEFAALSAKYAEGDTGMMQYKPFLDKVLASKHGVSGAFGPHVPASWSLSPPPSRSGSSSGSRPGSRSGSGAGRAGELPGLPSSARVPSANRPNSPRAIMSRPRTGQSAEQQALRELSSAMYYTPRSVAPLLVGRSGKVSGKIGGSADWGALTAR